MKKFLSIILILSFMLTSTIPVFAVASQNNVKFDSQKAIEIAKNSFDLNTDGYDFNQSYYESQEGLKQWELHWNSRKDGEDISISVDADTGDIMYMSRWKEVYNSPSKLSKYKRKDALKIADEVAKKLQPEKYNEMKLVDESSKLNNNHYDYDSYYFQYVRQVNGIPFKGNGINISIDKNTLELRNYNFAWTKGDLPDASKAIGLEKGKKAFNDKNGLELSYMIKYDPKAKDYKASLVYNLKNGNIPIDAITGESLNQSFYNPLNEIANDRGMGMAKEAQSLTPEEIEVVENISKYISKEKALEIGKKYIIINENQKLTHASLNSYNNGKDANWHFSWDYNNPEKNEYAYSSISIDALSGEIKNFYKSDNKMDRAGEGDPKYSKEQSKEFAEKFLKEIAPNRFSQTEYRVDNFQYEGTEKPRSYQFSYIRMVNGIPCPGNRLSVTVNTYTGDIISYHNNWSDIDFPKAENIISIDKAYEALYKNVDFNLQYINYYDYTIKYPNNNRITKLVYAFEDFSGMIDPKTGLVLDYNGEIIKDKNEETYEDIKGHWAENDIQALIEAGIIKADTKEFNPDAKIKQKDFVKILINSLQPYYPIVPYVREGADINEEYEEYYKQAIARKIINEKEKNMDAEISRIEAAKMIVNAMNLGYLAKKPEIFNINYKDGDKIPNELKGYVAIVSGLSIMSGYDGYFSPMVKLTKAESVSIIVKFLKVEKE